MKIFLLIFMLCLLVAGFVRAGDSLTLKGFNFTPEEMLNSFCPSTMALLTEVTPLKDDVQLIEKFKKQIREMVNSGDLSGQELQRAKIATVVGRANNTSIHLIQAGEGAQEKYFYVIPSPKDQKSPWGKLGTSQALKDLGPVVFLNNGNAIIQSSTRYAIINNSQTSQNIQLYYTQYKNGTEKVRRVVRYYYGGKDISNLAVEIDARVGDSGYWIDADQGWKKRPLYPMPDEVRHAFSEINRYSTAFQYLVDIGVLTLKRLETAKVYNVTSLKTKVNFDILEFDSDGPGSKKIRIYFIALQKKFMVRKTGLIEFGLLDTPEGLEKFGDRLQLKDGQVMKIVLPLPQGALTGQALLSELSGEEPASQVLIPQIFETENNSHQVFIAGPTDSEAYKIERTSIEWLKPEIDLESLASIHQYGAALEESVSSLSHKKMALQKIIFDESYWKIDGDKVAKLLARSAEAKPPTRLEVIEQIMPILKARRGDLVKYLGYLSEIKLTTQVTHEKLKEFAQALQGATSKRYPLDVAQVESGLKQYSAVLEGNLGGLDSEVNGVAQTIAYFKQVNLMLAASGSNKEIDSQLLADLKVLRKIFADLSGKDMQDLLVMTHGGGVQ